MGAFLQDVWNKYVWSTSVKSDGSNFTLKSPEAVARFMSYEDDFAKERVSERRAMGLAAVYTCMNVRSQTVASLPVNVIREEKAGNISIPDHPVYYPLAHQPNNYMTSANLFLSAMLNADGWGNSYIIINRNGRGEVRSLTLVPAHECDDVVVEDGFAWYKMRGEMYNSRDVLHFRWFSLDGLHGISPIRQNAMLMGKILKSERYSTYALGKRPPGVLSYEGQLTPPQKAENRKTWEEDLAQGRTPILSGRHHFDSFMINPVEAQYVQTEALTDKKVYGIFRVPPVFAQDYERATHTNAEQSDLIFAKHTITPIVRMIEQECNMKLFSEREKKTTFVKFNLNGLLRADTQTRAAFYTAMRNIGGMTGDEIREREDMPKYEGGDIMTIQGANVPIDQLRDFYAQKMVPSAEQNPPAKNLNGKFHEYFN